MSQSVPMQSTTKPSQSALKPPNNKTSLKATTNEVNWNTPKITTVTITNDISGVMDMSDDKYGSRHYHHEYYTGHS